HQMLGQNAAGVSFEHPQPHVEIGAGAKQVTAPGPDLLLIDPGPGHEAGAGEEVRVSQHGFEYLREIIERPAIAKARGKLQRADHSADFINQASLGEDTTGKGVLSEKPDLARHDVRFVYVIAMKQGGEFPPRKRQTTVEIAHRPD